MGGVENKHIKVENLVIFLAAIMNAQVPEIMSLEKEGHENHTKIDVVCYDENNVAHFLSSEDIIKIHQRFQRLAHNRRNKPNCKKEGSKKIEFTFQPNAHKKSI